MKSVNHAGGQTAAEAAKGLRRALVLFRILQILLALVASATTCWSLAVYSNELSRMNGARGFNFLAKSTNQPGWSKGGLDSGSYTWDDEVLSKWELEERERYLYGQVVISAVLLFLSLLTLCLSIAWLAYTTSPRARSKATCFGNHRPCTNYTCDLTWDIILAILWALLFALSVVSAVVLRQKVSKQFLVAAVVGCAFYGVMFVLFVITAALSGGVKRRLSRTAAPISA